MFGDPRNGLGRKAEEPRGAEVPVLEENQPSESGLRPDCFGCVQILLILN